MGQRDRTILWAFVLLNLGLKLLWLGRDELAHDEPFTVYQAFRPWADFVAMLGTENNPPLHFLLMRAWAPWVPLDAGWLRVPSALASAFTVWPLFLLARRQAGTIAAILAAAIFTLNQHLYGYAHEVRAYALFMLLTVAAFWQLVRMADGKPGARGWSLVVNVLLVYTHFFGWLVVGLQGLCMLLIKELRPRASPWGIALAVVGAYLPYAGITLRRAGDSIGGTWLAAPAAEEVYNMVWRWSNMPVVAIGLLVLIAMALWRTKGRAPGLALGLVWAMVPLLGMFLLSFWLPVYLDRYLVFAAPGFAILAGCAVAAMPGRMSLVAAIAVVLSMAATFEPWKGHGRRPSAVVAMAEAWRDSGPVLIQPPFFDHTYAWHLDPALLRDARDLRAALGERGIHAVHNTDDLPFGPQAWDTVVLVDAWAALTDPDATVKRALLANYAQVDSVEAMHKVWVYRFARRP